MQTKPKQKFAPSVLFTWLTTHAGERNITTFGPSQPALQTKPKQKFASHVLFMWLIHVDEKNIINYFWTFTTTLQTTKSHPAPNAQKKTLATPKLTSSPFNINVDLRKEEGGKKKILGFWGVNVSFPQLAEQNF